MGLETPTQHRCSHSLPRVAISERDVRVHPSPEIGVELMTPRRGPNLAAVEQ